MSPLEIAAVIFTLANVWLAVKQNIWTWPTGITSVILYGIFFWKEHLYSNAALQLVYLALSIHGWYEWLHGGANHGELHVRKTTARQWAGCAIAGTAFTFVILFGLQRWTAAPATPLADAFTTAFSLVGQWMMNEKLLENWIIWLVVDIVYVPMFAMAAHHFFTPSALLYAIFCVLAVRGYVEWKRTLVLGVPLTAEQTAEAAAER